MTRYNYCYEPSKCEMTRKKLALWLAPSRSISMVWKRWRIWILTPLTFCALVHGPLDTLSNWSKFYFCFVKLDQRSCNHIWCIMLCCCTDTSMLKYLLSVGSIILKLRHKPTPGDVMMWYDGWDVTQRPRPHSHIYSYMALIPINHRAHTIQHQKNYSAL